MVGTGGAPLYSFASTPLAASEVRDASTYGVLRLDLAPGSYSWQYIPTTTGGFTDSGSASCH